MENNILIELINSTATLIAAIAALLGGIAAILRSLPPKNIFRKSHVKEENTTVETEGKSMKNNKKKLRNIGVVSTLIAIFIITMRVVFAQGIAANQKLTNEAWDYYDKNEYESAILKATECINMFGGQAELEQEELINNNIPVPDTNPKSEEDKNKIFSRGLLNDVATCYFIIGQSYEKQGNRTEALRAYNNAVEFTHAMAYDPSGPWFWSVSKAAKGRVRQLEE